MLRDGGLVCIYDPEVKQEQVLRDMSMPKFEWDNPYYHKSMSKFLDNVKVCVSMCVNRVCLRGGKLYMYMLLAETKE